MSEAIPGPFPGLGTMLYLTMTLTFPFDVRLVAQAQSGKDLLGMLVPLIAFFGIFYFLLILPYRRQQKKTQRMLATLKAGDKVVTNGGIYGTIVGVDDGSQTVQLRIAEQVKIKVARSAIAGLQPEAKES